MSRAASVLLVLTLVAGGCLPTSVGPPPAATSSAPPPARTSSPTVGPSASGDPSAAVPTPVSTATPAPTPDPTAVPTPVRTAAPTQRATPAPPPTPAPTATTRPTPRPTPSPASRLVMHGSRTRPQVALTFDMGGRVGDALAIVDTLIDRHVPGSIFMTGSIAASSATDAGRDVLARIEAHPTQFTLGNHSYTHRDFRDLTATQIRDELRRTEAAFRATCRQDPRPFFRPPGGGVDAEVLAAVGAAGYRFTVTWDVDTIDWRPIQNDPAGPTADQIVAKVLADARSGSIVLMHLGGYHTLAALPRIVDGLRDRGFELVSLDEMF